MAKGTPLPKSRSRNPQTTMAFVPQAPTQLRFGDSHEAHPPTPDPEPGPEPKAKTQTLSVFGIEFPNEHARRAHFSSLLAEKLKDPAFRALPGFPQASDEDILRLSDPPWYTACPNPFLEDFIRHFGRPYRAEEAYAREPFAVNTSVGKTDALYKAHGYHTKVPHLAIVPSILHYTDPDDLVLDGFCGSGLMGVAAQWCGAAPKEFRTQLEQHRSQAGLPKIRWGARRAILNDLSPAATFIAQGFNLPFSVQDFDKAASKLLRDADKALGWMYQTRDPDSGRMGQIQYTVWSEVFACPSCSGDIVFVEQALDPETKRVRDAIRCPSCAKELVKKRRSAKATDEDAEEDVGALQRLFTTSSDPVSGKPWRRIRFEPVFMLYSLDGTTREKRLDADDRTLLSRIEALPWPTEVPSVRFPAEQMAHGSRIVPKGFTHVHHFFLPRAAQSLAFLWRSAQQHPDPRTRSMLLWFVEQAIWGMSILNRYQPIQQGRPGGSQVNRQLSGVYYVPSLISECSPSYNLSNRASRLVSNAFVREYAKNENVGISTGTGAKLLLPDASIDYIFTDPPFGENIYYADLNYLVEAWHRVKSQAEAEAIVDRAKNKDVHAYEGLMRGVLSEYHRVLKPGRWLTVVFSNSHNAVWNALQVALGEAGFVVADVRSLDKQQGSYRQVTSSAVKEDLVVTCYRPSQKLAFQLAQKGSPQLPWQFVEEHLSKLTLATEEGGKLQVLAERTADALYDRFVAFCLQQRMELLLDKPQFTEGLSTRFSERDGAFFLSTQVDAYDQLRARAGLIGQLDLIVTNEATAIQWIRTALTRSPQRFEDLQPDFMKQSQHWRKQEAVIDLRVLLTQNFLQDDAGRWYVADPSKASDMLKRRTVQLLKEFEGYVQDRRKTLEVVRRDALEAGFREAYAQHDYARILKVSRRLDPKWLEEDVVLYLFVANAETNSGEAV